MEKKKKGLFGRFMEYWRERNDVETTTGIGFQKDVQKETKHFSEMGAVFALSRQEIRQDLQRQETALCEGKKKPESNGESIIQNMEKKGERGTLWRQEPFLQEKEEKKRSRQLIPVREEKGSEEMEIDMTAVEMPVVRDEKKISEQTDIEALMRQITQKLWEEREGCGRRLR